MRKVPVRLKSISSIIVGTLVVAILAGACSTGVVVGGQPVGGTRTFATASNGSGLVQTSEGGSVTIELKWMNQDKSAMVFQVAMNTHSVDLDAIDLGKLATLVDESGRTYQPTAWNAPAGGHHRSGTLTFPTFSTIEQGQARYFEIMIRDVAGVKERVLRWQLTP